MNKFLFVSLFLLLLAALTGCKQEKPHLKVTYLSTINFPTNQEYNGTDTVFCLIDNGLVKEWNPYDKKFRIFDVESNKRIMFTQGNYDTTDYYFKVSEPEYKVNLLPDKKTILGYPCYKAEFISYADSITVYYTKELGVNYSPEGNPDGFVLEYWLKNKYINIHRIAVAIDNSDEKIAVPFDSYTHTTEQKFYHNTDSHPRRELITSGEQAPDFTAEDINRNIFSLNSNKGKVLVFNFWAIGCRGCVQEIPELNKLTEYFKNDKDVEFYAFTGDTKSSCMRFLKRKQFLFNIVPHAGFVNLKYGVNGFPTTLIINKDRKVLKVYYNSVIEPKMVDGVIKEIELALHDN
jgi:peroxiredoxin